MLTGFISVSQEWDEIEIKTTQVSDHIFMLEGRGGNIAVQKGEDGLLMVDAQYAQLSEKIKNAIAEIAEGRVTYLLNTHWHGDHTGGNLSFADDGATVIAHENVRNRVSTRQDRDGRISEPLQEGAWPILTFNRDMHIYFNNEDIHLFHVGKAHTDGDIMVYFAKENVLHMGDVYFANRYPYVDLSSKGDVEGFLRAVDHAIYLVNDDTKIIPGHGSLSNKKELIEYKKTLSTIIGRIKTAVEEGKSLEEVLNAGLSKEYDEDWSWAFINQERFTSTIYKYYKNINE